MESKKAEHLNLDRNRSSILLVGLVCGTALTLMSFEYTQFELVQEKNLMGLSEDECTIWGTPPVMPVTLVTTPPAQHTESKSEEIIEEAEDAIQEVEDDNEDEFENKDFPTLPKVSSTLGGPTSTTIIDSITTMIPDPVFPDQMPEFPGGSEAMMEFLSNKIVYPEECRQNHIGGKTFIQFTVEMDGSITDIQVVKAKHHLLGKEAAKVVGEMPNWIPGMKDNKKVRVRFTLPVNFVLD